MKLKFERRTCILALQGNAQWHRFRITERPFLMLWIFENGRLDTSTKLSLSCFICHLQFSAHGWSGATEEG